MKLFAHQGTRIYAPENTLAGYEIAAKMGFVGINFAQVRASANGTLYVMHDSSVDRTTNGQGNIVDLTDEQLSKLYVNRVEPYAEYELENFDKEDLRIPTLEEGLLICQKFNCTPMIRLGIELDNNSKPFHNLIDLIDRYCSSFLLSGSFETMEFLDKFFPNIPKVIYHPNFNVSEMVSSLNHYFWQRKETVFAMLKAQYLSKQEIQKLENAGYKAYASNPGDIRHPDSAKIIYKQLEEDGCVYANAERYPIVEEGK